MRYASVSSLGSYCQAAYQVRRLTRDVIKGPLDWVFVHRRGLLACIDTDFETLGRFEHLVITADLQRVQDRVFGVDFYHAFARDELHRIKVYDLRCEHEAFDAKLRAMVGRYRAIQGRHLFVWAVDRWYLDGVSGRQGATEVLSALRRRHPESDLLIVQSDAEPESEWGGGVLNRYTPDTPGRWQGDDDAWEAIFRELGLLRDDVSHVSALTDQNRTANAGRAYATAAGS